VISGVLASKEVAAEHTNNLSSLTQVQHQLARMAIIVLVMMMVMLPAAPVIVVVMVVVVAALVLPDAAATMEAKSLVFYGNLRELIS